MYNSGTIGRAQDGTFQISEQHLKLLVLQDHVLYLEMWSMFKAVTFVIWNNHDL